MLTNSMGQRDTFVGTYNYMSVGGNKYSHKKYSQLGILPSMFAFHYLSEFCVYFFQPERISGGAYGFDSDIWSLGLVILELAIGRFPYLPPGKNDGWLNFYELLETIVEQPPPSAPADQFSPEFCSFIAGWSVVTPCSFLFYYI